MRTKVFFAIFYIISTALFAQRGRDGSATITSTVAVNEYTYLTADEPAGSTTITVAASTLNAHGRFSGNLASGDLIMIIQMQGATLNGSINPSNTDVGQPKDSSWGAITSYNNCGNYEFAEVSAVPNGTTIKLDCPLQYSYTDTGKVQIVRVPRYNTLIINSSGTIICDQWDSTIGGVIAMEVENNTVINSGGSINADSAGFRGGRYNGEDDIGWGIGDVASPDQSYGKEKGEGIGGYEWNYAKFGGKEAMGAPGNGGGGGNAQNAGGGGGANGGVLANYINGFGNPDVSTPDNITAWNLEYSWMSAFHSSGGGRGGYSFSGNNENPLVDGPGNISAAWATDWGGDQRRSVGGRGGHPLDYSTGRIFMGGGGGAGDQNNDNGGQGGKGGGIIYIMSYGTVSGAGQILANGENGFNTEHPAPAIGHTTGIDAAGGAGGGGTIIVNSVGNISGITLTANGGTGGSQVMQSNVNIDEEAEGPGGGGGGGYIATSNAGPTETTTGGANGTTNARPMTNFLPNGATIGGGGTTGAMIANFHLVAQNDTICSGNTATLSASISGTPPSGTSIEWYTVDSGGTAVGTGTTYTTPVLTTATTYYVGSCPGTYRMAVIVVVEGASAVTVSPPNVGICVGVSDTIKASGGSAYAWLPASSLNNPAIANPVATPTITTTYTVSITTPCGVVKDSVKITVNPLPIAIISPDTSICLGNSITLSATGGGTYLWEPSGLTTSSISVSPTADVSYTVTVTKNGCTNLAHDTVLVASALIVNITPPQKICAGDNAVLKATGGGIYRWSNGATTDSISVSPTGTTNYTVTVTNGCIGKANTSVTVYNPTIAACCDTIIQSGNSTHLSASGSGITHFIWTPNTDVSCDTCPDVVVSPTVTTSYTVTGTDSLGCSKENIILVAVEQPCTGLIIPNVFTPTNPGPSFMPVDNEFYINTISLNSWSVLIFDRWGKEVFKTSSLTQYWDGKTESGGQAPAGVYYYIINATCDGTTTKKQGFVQLIR